MTVDDLELDKPVSACILHNRMLECSEKSVKSCGYRIRGGLKTKMCCR